MLYSVGELEWVLRKAWAMPDSSPTSAQTIRALCAEPGGKQIDVGQGLRVDNYISMACAVKAGRDVDKTRQGQLGVVNLWQKQLRSEKVGSLVISHDFVRC